MPIFPNSKLRPKVCKADSNYRPNWFKLIRNCLPIGLNPSEDIGADYSIYLSDGKLGIFYYDGQKLIAAICYRTLDFVYNDKVFYFMKRGRENKYDFIFSETISEFDSPKKFNPRAAAFARSEVVRLSKLIPKDDETDDQFRKRVAFSEMTWCPKYRC